MVGDFIGSVGPLHVGGISSTGLMTRSFFFLLPMSPARTELGDLHTLRHV